MKQKRPIIKSSRAVEELHHLRLMALMRELVRDRGKRETARVLDIDHRTVTGSLKAGRLSKKTCWALERALQYGVGSAADEQRERSDKLEARLDKLEAQLKELKENHRTGLMGLKKSLEAQLGELKRNHGTGLKRLKMSLDGVRKYYAVQRRLIEQRLVALEADREGTETGASADDESRAPGSISVAARSAHPRQLTDATPTESPDAEEKLSMPLERDVTYAAHGANIGDAPALSKIPRSALRSRRKLARSEKVERDIAEAG